MDRCYVLGWKSYDFTKDNGERLQGLHVHYIDDAFRDDTENQMGVLPMKVPAISAVKNQLAVVPAYYDLDFRQRPDGRGKPVLTLVAAGISDDQGK